MSCLKSGLLSFERPYVMKGAFFPRMLLPFAFRYCPVNLIVVASLCNSSKQSENLSPAAITGDPGQEGSPVGVEQPVKCPTHTVVGKRFSLFWLEAESLQARRCPPPLLWDRWARCSVMIERKSTPGLLA